MVCGFDENTDTSLLCYKRVVSVTHYRKGEIKALTVRFSLERCSYGKTVQVTYSQTTRLISIPTVLWINTALS